jgi:hypothetical protein
MAQTDSIDKIVTRYLVAVTNEEFTYKGILYFPKPLKLSPGLLRGFTCPENCGACCPRFSLDYLPDEKHPYLLAVREVIFNHEKITIYSDLQKEHTNYHCKNLIQENARCRIHETRPFSCDFELIRPLIFQSSNTPNAITQRLFGRGWSMMKVDERRGCFVPDNSTYRRIYR